MTKGPKLPSNSSQSKIHEKNKKLLNIYIYKLTMEDADFKHPRVIMEDVEVTLTPRAG